MFNFQKETIINNVAETVRLVTDKTGKLSDKVLVHDGGNYATKFIVDKTIYRTDPSLGKKLTITFDVSALNSLTKSPIQISIELGLNNQYRADFGSALYYFRRPILISLDPAVLTVDKFEKALRSMLPSGNDLFVITADGENETVTLTAENTYLKLRKMEIVGLECNGLCNGEEQEEPVVLYSLEKVEDATDDEPDAKVGDIATVINGVPEFGTYNYLLQNLRLPTYENYRFTSPMAVEMPVRGVNYVQFSFMYCVPRVGLGGMSAAGQMIHSTTCHTFYVPSDQAKDFSDMFTGVTIENVSTKHSHIVQLPDKEGDKEDLGGDDDETKNDGPSGGEE